MASKVRVYGKAQNRTALGIVHAYMKMFPNATLEDLRKAFPNSVNPDKGVPENFLPLDEAVKYNDKMSLYFAKPDEMIELQDGSKVALAQVWSKPSFERMVDQGKTYDIEVAEFEKTMKGERGGYRLEYLNGYVPPMTAPVVEKKKSNAWLWILLLLLIAAGVIAYLLTRQPKVVEKEVIVEKEIVVRDTVYLQQVEEIEKNFNAAQFEQGKADLNDDAKLALHDLAKVMKQNPDLKLRIVGHTSSEGDASANQKLSEERAKAAVDFLVNKEKIDGGRLEAVGMGSAQLKDPKNPESDVNRRTEFEIM